MAELKSISGSGAEDLFIDLWRCRSVALKER